MMASASNDKCISLWELHQEDTMLEIRYLDEIKKDKVNSIMWDHSSKRLLVGAENCKIYDTTEMKFTTDFKSNSGKVSNAIWVVNST